MFLSFGDLSVAHAEPRIPNLLNKSLSSIPQWQIRQLLKGGRLVINVAVTVDLVGDVRDVGAMDSNLHRQ